MKAFLCIFCGLFIGLGIAYIFFPTSSPVSLSQNMVQRTHLFNAKQEIVGFLPYWLLSKEQPSVLSSLTTLTYFSLSLDPDGSITTLTTPTQTEPGWYNLESGKASAFLDAAKQQHKKLSLTVFSGNHRTITSLLANPNQSAKNLLSSVLPVMNRFGFTDLNIDIEAPGTASAKARSDFVLFLTVVAKELKKHSLTLTVDISPVDVVEQVHLINPQAVGRIADHVILMAYDYHYPDSSVSGPIAPVFGAGITSEYDVVSAITKTLALVPSEKIILGIPLYGYEWETLGNSPRSAVIPGTGVLASTRRIQALQETCTTCTLSEDSEAVETFLTYQDKKTHTYHQFFYPTRKSTQKKMDVVSNLHLLGVGLWALGYEDTTLLLPLVKN